ncbi:unnamed protein product [Dovyalis caffra]|uniref:Carboxypeptidase n=2 Tax=Magnoliopsida TaxID=3398 RepID=A0AAV1RN50_9ROSI|nr:unnamed protein product [Dovyalis caffra]
MANPRLAFGSFQMMIVSTIIIFFNLFLDNNGVYASSLMDPVAQQQLDRVRQLPGQTFDLSFAHYSGYVTVNEKFGKALFYWFVEAVEDPQSKPLVLWLNGGPGCSSIAYGMAEEIGPFHIKPDGKSLYLNPYSWNQVANILFLDSPVGVGYSYSNTSSDVLNNGDKKTAADSLAFLLNWFERFPQYKGRDFYITGESYAGHYVPQLSQAIVWYNRVTKDKKINLRGYMVGNALTDDYHDHLGVFQFLWAAGLISDQTYKKLNFLCDFESFVHMSDACYKIQEIASEELGNIDPYSIFTPSCSANISQSNLLPKRKHMVGRVGEKYDPCTEAHSTVYFNLPEVQKALHVSPEFAPAKWETCSEMVSSNWKDSPRTVLDVYQELIHSGLRVWVFSGDTDSIIPITSTRYSIDALKLPTVKPWHAWYDDGQVGGWTQEYAGLTFVSVRGAGHEVPLHKPKLALTLIKAFLSGTSMPTLQLVVKRSRNQSQSEDESDCKRLVACAGVLIKKINLDVGSNGAFSSSLGDPVAHQQLERVLELLGQTFNVSFPHCSGQITANETFGRDLYNWFVEAVEDPQSKLSSYYLQFTSELTNLFVKNSCCFTLSCFEVGNPVIDDYHDHLGLLQFLWAAGLISDQTYVKSVYWFLISDNEYLQSPSANMVVSSINPHNKEILIRRRITSIFNKREEDFPSLKEYNDYLEEVEDMIFNLVAGVDVTAIEEKIAEYEKENADLILINQARKAEELALAMAASKGPPAQTDNTDGSSQGGISVEAGQYAPTIAGGQPRPIGIAPQPVPVRGGPDMHGRYAEDEETMRIRTERANRAAGWSIEFSKKRALEEAFASICV